MYESSPTRLYIPGQGLSVPIILFEEPAAEETEDKKKH